MELFDVIRTRRSIRSYRKDPVPEELVKEILDAARWAPSGKNRQHWHFIVITDETLKKKVGEIWGDAAQRYFGKKTAESLYEEMKEQPEEFRDEEWVKTSQSGSAYRYCFGAPLLIAVAINNPEIENNFPSAFQAIQNMILAAHALGLGTCVTRRIVKRPDDRKKFQRLLKVPEDYEMVALVTVGYPAKIPVSRRRDLKEMVHYDTFGNR